MSRLTYPERGLLHKSKLEEFKQWLIDNGWTIEDHSKNQCAVLRARNIAVSKHPLIIYETVDSKEHYTVQGRHRAVVNKFIYRNRNNEKGEK